MVNDDETTARNAESTTTNDAGMCLQWSRQRAAIGSRYGDAATAWRNTNDRHPGDRNPPRGSMVFWTGGANGYGHIAPSVGGGNVRSTDSGGKGKPATVDIDWPVRNWGLTYAGWAWDVNEVTIPRANAGKDDDDMGDVNLKQTISRWDPETDKPGDTLTLGKAWSITQGYAEKAYMHATRIEPLQNQVKALEGQITALQNTVNQILAKLG